MRAPLLPVAVAFAAGIVTGHLLTGNVVLVVAGLLTVATLLPASRVWCEGPGRMARLGLLALVGLAGFWCRSEAHV